MRNTDGNLGTVLGIWAHPDDEAYSMAGLMVTAVRAGRRVVCLTATRGEAGFPPDDTRTVAERKAVRERELEDCLGVLGVTEHRYLGFPDGGCLPVPDAEPVALLTAAIAEIQPDTILTFGPDGGTGHPDHITVCRWVTLAVAATPDPKPRLLYSTKGVRWAQRYIAGVDRSRIMMADIELMATPDAELAIHFTCPDDLADLKVAALRAQASQVEPFVQTIGVQAFREMFREEFFREPAAGDRAALDRNRNLTFRT